MCFYIYLQGDIAKDFKRDIYSVSLSGEKNLRKIETLDQAILTATTISTSLKKTVSKIETLKLSDIGEYFENVSPFFEKSFFSKFMQDKSAEAQFLLNSDVRVTSFVVTEDPVFVGVDISQPRPIWLFHVKGNYMRDGVFSKRTDRSTFGEKTIWVSVQESVGQNGNPAGIEIVNYEVIM
ncbi:hypothetical protein EA58_19760 [Photobacterium galatheae]|uniref:Uncharacterized protein n=2 Tax=Photobacterium galatheae TaxID=1654360 RepID=A0A066RRF1_9GAMM|nr:hypothetical protein EA58_19760 [Photobacterium galatheae]